MPVVPRKEKGRTIYDVRVWYTKNGKQKSVFKSNFKRRIDADSWFDEMTEKFKGTHSDAVGVKLKDFLERWIKTKEGKLSPTTLNGYKVNIRHINKHIGNLVIHEINLIDVQEMLDALSKSGLKQKTVRYVYRTLNSAINYAIKSKMIKDNFCKGAEINEDDEQFKIMVYSSDDLRNLIIMLREQRHGLYAPVLLAAMMGLRRGECIGMPWSNIDFDGEVAYISNNYVVVGGIPYHRKVKTKDSDRMVGINGYLSEELKRMKDEMNRSGTIQTYVCEVEGNLPDPTHISRQLKSFQKANNLPTCRFHDLRHSFAMLQLEYGTDLDTLRRILGHSKISVTSDLYLRQNKNLIKKASAAMSTMMSKNCCEIVVTDQNETAK